MEALRDMARSRDAPARVICPDDIESFLENLEGKGREKGTIEKYRRDLFSLYAFLPPDKCLEPDVLERWQEAQLEEGYVPRTVNSRISAANSFFAYIGRRDLQVSSVKLSSLDVQPELTRTEYLRLLQTARILGRERSYLLVKVFGCMGLQVQELPKLTVEAAEAGRIEDPTGLAARIPACLQAELLDYARREYIQTGPIFVTRSGRPLNRSNVTESIRRLCRDARVDEAKGNPRCLRRLCLSTRTEIQVHLALLAEQTYDRLLETEQVSVGWESYNKQQS